MKKAIVMAAFVVVAVGCTKSGRYMPITPGAFGVAIPAQQETLSQAVRKAVSTLKMEELKGKSAYVEVGGILASSGEFIKYVRMNIEARLATQGVKILPYSVVIDPDGSVAFIPPVGAEYRVLVNLDEVGADSLVEERLLLKDNFYYQGKFKATVTACHLNSTFEPIAPKNISGEGDALRIEGSYTKESL